MKGGVNECEDFLFVGVNKIIRLGVKDEFDLENVLGLVHISNFFGAQNAISNYGHNRRWASRIAAK